MVAETSDWLADEAAKYFFLSTSMGTRPTEWHVALIKPDGSEVASGDDANYARQSVTFSTTGTAGQVSNDSGVSFPAAEAGADYDIAEFAVYDDASAGNLLVQETLEFQKNVVGGNVIAFAAGELITGFNTGGS